MNSVGKLAMDRTVRHHSGAYGRSSRDLTLESPPRRY